MPRAVRRTVRASRWSSRTWIGLAFAVLVGAAVRAWVLASPLGAVEADESVVGLMALHILAGEFPVFYWGQPYLGSLEAYLVAGAFALLEPSNLTLKLVPGLVYLAFVLLVFLGARRDYGDQVALASVLYLALPPSFLLFWSLKARGGYVEVLALGQALVVASPWVVRGGPRLPLRVGLAGLLAGLLIWTHVLGLVYVLPAGLYLVFRLGRRLLFLPLLAGLLGFLIGSAPLLVHNLQTDWETFHALSTGETTRESLQENLHSLLTVGLPVMFGLGQATSSPVLFAEDWPHRPGSWPWAPPVLLTLLILALLPSLHGLSAPFRGPRGERLSTAYFGLAVLLLTPLLASAGRFGELVAEPRYALPLYSAVPLLVAGLFAATGRRPLLLFGLGALLLTLNTWSVFTADPRLNLPTTAGASTEATRAELLRFLEAEGLTAVYTDYWLAYPLIFESGERVNASAISGGYNRFAPYAHEVSVTERPAWVFVRGSPEHAAFTRRLTELNGRARREWVSIYEVYYDVLPLERLRPS